VLNSRGYVEHNITTAPGRAMDEDVCAESFLIPETTSSTWCGSMGRVSISEQLAIRLGQCPQTAMWEGAVMKNTCTSTRLIRKR
jgi:hypothetical protein